MQRISIGLIAVLLGMGLCVGCSTIKPSPDQGSAAVTPPAAKQASATYEYPFQWFVRGWLEGKAYTPDYEKEEGKEDWGWYGIGLILASLGQGLAR